MWSRELIWPDGITCSTSTVNYLRQSSNPARAFRNSKVSQPPSSTIGWAYAFVMHTTWLNHYSPKKLTYPLKNYGWKMNLHFEMVPFQVIWVIFGGVTQLVKINQSPETDRTQDRLLNQPLETGTRHHVFQGWSARPVEVRIFRMREVSNSTFYHQWPSNLHQSTNVIQCSTSRILLGIAHLPNISNLKILRSGLGLGNLREIQYWSFPESERNIGLFEDHFFFSKQDMSCL